MNRAYYNGAYDVKRAFVAALTVWPGTRCEVERLYPNIHSTHSGLVDLLLRVSPVQERCSWHWRCATHPYKYGNVFWKWKEAAEYLPLWEVGTQGIEP